MKIVKFLLLSAMFSSGSIAFSSPDNSPIEVKNPTPIVVKAETGGGSGGGHVDM